MEFWGVEVKSAVPLKVTPADGKLLHLSQACLGEVKKEKGSDSVNLAISVDGKKLLLGTLSTDRVPQQLFDLVFERDFEISHNWKNGSVFFLGYLANSASEEDDLSEGASDLFEEDIPNNVATNGKPASKPMKNEISADDLMSDDDEDEDDESGESDEETPKKDVVPSKKRAAEPASKTPVQAKKAKSATPQKTDGKKPAKQAGSKTPGSGDKPNQSGGAHSCNTCSRAFGSEKALESHTKAKHSAAK